MYRIVVVKNLNENTDEVEYSFIVYSVITKSDIAKFDSQAEAIKFIVENS